MSGGISEAEGRTRKDETLGHSLFSHTLVMYDGHEADG